ncbi:MAG: hypothetical protein ACRBN8_01315 [Nannocystales bacterium]
MPLHRLVSLGCLAAVVSLGTGCTPQKLDPGYLAAHEAVAEAQCCRARYYASATGESGSVADEMNAFGESCTAEIGGVSKIADYTQKALPEGFDSEFDYTEKLSEDDQKKIKELEVRGQECSVRATEAWNAKTGGV